MNEGGASGTIQFVSEKAPGKETQKLSLVGTFVLIIGKEMKTEVKELQVTEGSKVKLGPLEATVSSRIDAGDPTGQLIQLSTSVPIDAISKIEFVDSKGAVIQSSPAGSGSYGTVYQNSYYVESQSKTLNIRVSYFQKTERVKLPANFHFGLGL